MRKLMVSVLIFSLTFMCACSKGEITPVVKGVTFNAHVFYFDKEYTFSVDIENDGSAVLEVVEPTLISKARIVINKDTAYAQYQDIKYPVELSRAKGAPYFLIGSLGAASDKKAIQNGEDFILSGKWQETEYQMYLSGSGIPLKIKAENIEIEILDAKIKTAQ